MALCMEVQTTSFGSFTTVDIAALKLARFRLSISYGHASKLTFVAHASQETYPLGLRTFIRFWDDAGTDPDGNAFSSSNPLFEGFIEEVEPTDNMLVTMSAYDPTYKASKEFNLMSEPWNAGVIGVSSPTYSDGVFPRLVFNSKIDNDDDYAWQRLADASVYQILKTIFEDQYHPLYWSNAAPGDGTSAGNQLAYIDADINGLSFKPQGKEVFESEGIRSAVMRLLRYYPNIKLIWFPGTRQWRFINLLSTPQVTLTLNSHNASNVVLSLDLYRSLEGRYTSIKFFGPTTSVTETALLSDGSLTNISDSIQLQNNIATCCNVSGMNRWQITDPDKRRIIRQLPNYITVQTDDYSYVQTRSATLEAYWPENNTPGEAGYHPAGWRAIWPWNIDALNGIIEIPAPLSVYRYNATPAAGSPNYEVPTDIRFRYGRASTPIMVRYPETGFSGTAFSVANLRNEKQIYDEMLAVGYEYNNPVTTPTRLAQYQLLAQFLHSMLSDIVYTGNVVLNECRFEFCWLNRRVNIAAVDGGGASKTTGWESINAYLTDVEYDFDERLTTLTFSADQMEQIGMDVDAAKARLGIRALEQRELPVFAWVHTTIRPRTIGEGQVKGFSSMWNQWDTVVGISGGGFEYVDPVTGKGERAL